MLAHYGNFRNVKNYIVLAGKQDEGFDFRCGYYGEKMVLFAQQRGLNTCWTALTFNKKRVKEIVARRRCTGRQPLHGHRDRLWGDPGEQPEEQEIWRTVCYVN